MIFSKPQLDDPRFSDKLSLLVIRVLLLVTVPSYLLSAYRAFTVDGAAPIISLHTLLMIVSVTLALDLKGVTANVRYRWIAAALLLVAVGATLRSQTLAAGVGFVMLAAIFVYITAGVRWAMLLALLGYSLLGMIALQFDYASIDRVLRFVVIYLGLLAVLLFVVDQLLQRSKMFEARQREVSERLAASQAEAEKQSTHLRQMSDAAQVSLVDIDIERQLMFGNKEFYARVGLPEDTVGISTDTYFSRVHEPVRSQLPQMIADLISGPAGETITFIHAFDGIDGLTKHYRVTAEYAEQDGRPFIFGISVDVTELVESQRKVEQHLAEIDSQRERQKRMYAVIGHELRTPAAALKMMLDALDEDEAPDTRQFSANIEQLLGVIDSLRTVALPKELLQQARVSERVDRLIEQQITEFQALAQQHGVEQLTASVTNLNLPIKLQRSLLRQVLGNLIKNAIIHSAATQIEVAAELTGKGLQIEVQDNGKGIPAEAVEGLFEAFVRGSTDAEGTGLGLHICREIVVEQFGGDLQYKPSPEGGSIFIIEMPLNMGNNQPDPVLPSVDTLFRGRKILLAEDNKTIQLLTEKMLAKQGAVVSVANNGEEALNLFSDGDFDLVLSDIFMPQLDGYGLVSMLRERDYAGPIVGLTAATVGEETERMLVAGADRVLSKPISIDKLAQVYAELRDA